MVSAATFIDVCVWIKPTGDIIMGVWWVLTETTVLIARHEIVTVNGLRAGNWNWEKSHLRFWDGKMLKRKKKRKSMLNMERWDIRNS